VVCPVAAQVVVSLAVLALPCSLPYWLRCVGLTERWWALLGSPLAYGFSFNWGFLNFVLAGTLFRETDMPVVLVAQSGLWYLYKPLRAERAKEPQR
jgi:hypothetical protein